MKFIKIQLLTLCSLALVLHLPAGEASPPEPNPALLYWQAFAVMADLAPDDQKHLFETDWRNRPMDSRAGELIERFDQSFRLLRRAAAMKTPCDWGVDLAAGPDALFPHLGKAKRCAQAAVLRAHWFVQHNQQAAARDDLLGALVLGRNLARDQVLISGLVQIAIENILSGWVVQEWPELHNSTIESILSHFDGPPERGMLAASMPTEKVAFYGWLIRKIEAARAAYPNDDARSVAELSQLLDRIPSGEGEKRNNFGTEIIKAAGNTTAGLLQYVREIEPFYDEMETVMKLPYSEFQTAIEDLQRRVASHPNKLLRELLPAPLKVRTKEFRVSARLAMLHAAYQIRLDSAHGLQKVQDPFGTGPFAYSRFLLDGIDRGFKLKSQLKMPEFEEVLVFAEKTGAGFYIDGPRAGQKTP